ncbi:hypothetical protein ADK43_40205 [Streptomyces rimosus subsp. rimosus]|nr:hypothetical protein ADK43_40205 [Streptomyces rimosus subsp. rimosus]
MRWEPDGELWVPDECGPSEWTLGARVQRTPTSPKRTRIIGLYTDPLAGATVICADELGSVIPRTCAV